jgi:hypothetical protein
MKNSIEQIIADVTADESLQPQQKTKLLNALENLPTPLQTDLFIYRLVVTFLGLTVIGTVAGGFILTFKAGAEIPQGLVALGSAAVGALAGLLAPVSSAR